MHVILIDRPRLIARLRDAVAAYPLTIATAPLGAGKTAALDLAFGSRAGVARVELEAPQDAAPVAALVEAIRPHRDDFGRLTLGALSSGAAPVALARVFAGDLRHLDRPLLIAIDNAHLLGSDGDGAEFIAELLGRLPGGVRLICSGRAMPERDLLDVVARGRATVIGSDAFRFARDEIGAVAARVGRAAGPAEIAAIERATDGWAAGIVLALSTPPGHLPALRSLDIAAVYLESALVPALSPGALRFLEEAAVFESLDVNALERSAVFGSARTALAELARGGALVSAASGERETYRMNPILRTVALRRLGARGGISNAHAAAAEVCVAGGAIGAALVHVVAAGDAQVAEAFLRAHAAAALATGDRARVRDAAALVEAGGGDAGVAAFARGLDAKASGVADARAWFVRAETAARACGDERIAVLAVAQIMEHDLGRLRRVDPRDRAAIRANAQRLGPAATVGVEIIEGWAAAIAFDFAAARDRAALLRSDDAAVRADIGILAAYAQTALGEFEAAQATMDGAVRALEDDDRVVAQTLALVWFARLGLTWGATNAASDAALQAARLASTLDFRAEEAALYGALTEIATHRGDPIATLEHAERTYARAPHAWYIADVERLHAFAGIAAARAAFLNGDHASARALAQRIVAEHETPVPMRALALAEAAMYTLLCDASAAPAVIDASRAALRAAEPRDVADAATLTAAGDLIAFLAAANGESAGERFPTSGPFDAFVIRRRGLITLEVAGIAVGNARRGAGSAEAIGAAFAGCTRGGPRFEVQLAQAYAARFTRPAAPPAAVSLPDLTAREREILVLLVDGLTNKEIAQRTVLSPRTVETHVERILSKLEVGSRSRAIAKALRIGLVELG